MKLGMRFENRDKFRNAKQFFGLLNLNFRELQKQISCLWRDRGAGFILEFSDLTRDCLEEALFAFSSNQSD